VKSRAVPRRVSASKGERFPSFLFFRVHELPAIRIIARRKAIRRIDGICFFIRIGDRMPDNSSTQILRIF
jgi:hypothetical protein